LYPGFGTTHAIVYVFGYTRRDNSGTRLTTMAPKRLVDTRLDAPGKLGDRTTAPLDLTVRGGTTTVPADADSVVLNMTVTNASNTGSFLTVWPSGTAKPGVSNLNNIAGVARPNVVVARVGTNDKISIANDSGTADVIADVVGYFKSGAYKSGGVVTGLTPRRVGDTRSGLGFAGAAPFAPFSQQSITVRGGSTGVPGTAKTAILKVTAVDPTSAGFLTVWPSGNPSPPTASNLNFGPNMTIPNLVITQIGSDGKINIFNENGFTKVLVDILGYAD
jgi:hypothetical protein